MKKTILILFVLAVSTALHSQDSIPIKVLTKADYLRKSKVQTIVAIPLAVTSMVCYIKGFVNFSDENIFEEEYVHNYWPTFGLGTAALVGSIVLTVTASKNRKKAKAATVFIDMEHAPVLQPTALSTQIFPAIGIRLKL